MASFISCNEKNEKDQAPTFLVKNFFKIYEEKGVDNALNSIFQTNKYMIEQPQSNIDNIKESLSTHISLIGNYHGYEIVSEYSLGKSLKHYCCIVKYDKQPLRFNFIFYKSETSWVLHNFNFDNKIVDELDEMAEYHYY